MAEHVGAQDVVPRGRAVVARELQHEGRAGVPVPDLGGVDAMPDGGRVRALEEVVDGRADGAVAGGAGQQRVVAEGLDVVASFHVRDET